MPTTPSGVRRRAFVSLPNLLSNARTILGTASAGSALADVRADAYGHGLFAVADALAGFGVAGFIVSSDTDRAVLAARHGDSIIRIAEPDPEDAARAVLGTSFYGLTASEHRTMPALRLVAEAVAVKTVAAGRGVSYGYTYRTTSATTLVLAGLGYADGIPRIASNRAPVFVAGTRARVTGRIAMDQFVVDVGGGPASVAVGDDVVLFGDAVRGEPTVVEWAHATGLRPEVIVAGLGPRIERVYE